MGNTSGTSTNYNILVYNITGVTAQPLKTISFSNTYSNILYGYYYSLKWYNNILYIGTYIGTYPEYGSSYSNTFGYLFAYDMLNDNVNVYTSLPTYAIGGIDVDPSFKFICTTCLYSSMGAVTSYTPLNIFSGFYLKTSDLNYGIDIG
jgi:hypothetical protein